MMKKPYGAIRSVFRGVRGKNADLIPAGRAGHWLPRDAADLPDGVVLFDGVCALCEGWVRFIIPRDPAGRYRFIAIQSDAGRRLAARFGIDADAPETNVVIRDGTAWFKGDSALRVWRDLPGWRWTRVFHIVPRPLRNFLYDLVARNRYRLFGRHETCLMPTPDIRSRFIVPPGVSGEPAPGIEA